MYISLKKSRKKFDKYFHIRIIITVKFDKSYDKSQQKQKIEDFFHQTIRIY